MSEPEARRLKSKMDRRLLILYGLLVFILAAALTYIQYDLRKTNEARHQFEDAIIENCQVGLKNTRAFNELIETARRAVAQNPDLNAAERRFRLEAYEKVTQIEPECPPAEDHE
jgi:hypothetical protein